MVAGLQKCRSFQACWHTVRLLTMLWFKQRCLHFELLLSSLNMEKQNHSLSGSCLLPRE